MFQVNKFLSQSGMRKDQVEKEMERAYNKYFSSLARKEGGGGGFRPPAKQVNIITTITTIINIIIISLSL